MYVKVLILPLSNVLDEDCLEIEFYLKFHYCELLKAFSFYVVFREKGFFLIIRNEKIRKTIFFKD